LVCASILDACKRGWSRAEKKVVIGDGAEWIWHIADQHFPGAIQIVDLYHARQHLWELARKLFPNQQAEQERWMVVHKDALLDEGKIEDLVASLRSIVSSNPELSEKIRMEADYFQKNTERMRYPEFRAQHLFVGSGVIEAGCKAIIRLPLQAVRHVLDRARGERHPGIAMLPFQRPLRGLLGGASPGGLISTSTSRTRGIAARSFRPAHRRTPAPCRTSLTACLSRRGTPVPDLGYAVPGALCARAPLRAAAARTGFTPKDGGQVPAPNRQAQRQKQLDE
jgi:hypothetical protein